MIVSFQILYNSSYISHPSIGLCIVWIKIASLNDPQNILEETYFYNPSFFIRTKYLLNEMSEPYSWINVFFDLRLRQKWLKSSLLWFGPIEVYWRFGGIYCFQLYGRRVIQTKQTTNQQVLLASLFLNVTSDSADKGPNVSPKRCRNSTRLYDVRSQKKYSSEIDGFNETP
jgi:hypothetical protein